MSVSGRSCQCWHIPIIPLSNTIGPFPDQSLGISMADFYLWGGPLLFYILFYCPKRETNLSNSFTTNGSLTVVSIPFILAPTILDVSIVTYSYYCISKMPMDPQYLPPSLSYGCRRVPTTVGPLLNHLHQWLHYTPYLHFLIYPSPILPSPEPVPGILQ